MYEENILIFENPDGSIQLGTQPHYREKKLLQCFNCEAQIIIKKTDILVACANCDKINKNILESYIGIESYKKFDFRQRDNM